MFCLNCGTQLPEGGQVCPECGTELPATLQSPAVPDTAEQTNETEEITEAGIADEEVSENANQNEDGPRLYQEPAPAAIQEPIPAPAPMPNNMQNPAPDPTPYQMPPTQPQYQQMPNQPQYQQMPNQPQYQQMPNQPQYQQVPNQPQYQQMPNQQQYQQMPNQQQYQQMPAPAAAPVVPKPFMKRKEYFKSPAAEKIRGKLDLLNTLTGIGFGAIMVCYFFALSVLFFAVYDNDERHFCNLFTFEISMYTVFIASIAVALILALFGMFCLIGMKTKHFGAYIPLLLPSILLAAASAFVIINVIDTEFNYHFLIAAAMALFSVIALVLSVISLALSIIVSKKYKNDQREYMWGAANR